MTRIVTMILAAVMTVLTWPPAATADDLFLRLSRPALQRFVDQLCPLTLSHTLSSDFPVRLIVKFTNPRITFHPASPSPGGHITIGLDYHVQSVPPLVKPLSGRITPRLIVSFDPRSQSLLMRIKGLNIQIPGSVKIPLDKMLPDQRLPLGSMPPIQTGNRQVAAAFRDVRIWLTPDHLMVSIKLDFTGGYSSQ